MANSNSSAGVSENVKRPSGRRPAVGGSPGAFSPERSWRLLREGNGILVSILLLLLVAGAYLSSLRNGFVSLDDPVYVYENLHVRQGLTWEGIRWAFSSPVASLWHPLTLLSLMVDSQLFGSWAGGYHLTSLLLHAANTLLLFVLLKRLTSASWRSAFVAALFGLHPLHVESVAWVAERKDVLSTLFWLLALWAYVRYAEKSESTKLQAAVAKPKAELKGSKPPGFGAYLLCLLFFALGLMSKPMVVTLPFTLLLMDYWPLQRLGIDAQTRTPAGKRSRIQGLVLEKLPFFALSLLLGIVTMWAQRGAGAFMTSAQLPVSHRIANALLTYVHYLVQMVWPGRYAMYYPYPKGFSTSAVLLAVLLLLIPSAFALRAWRRRPYFAFGWLWYIVTLLPVIGLIQVGNQAQADRYTYIPFIGIFVLVAWGLNELSRGWLYQKPVLTVAGGAAIILCFAFTREQISYWKDSETLSRHALSVTQNNEVALNILGIAESKQGRLDNAILCWEQAVALAPHYAHAQANLGAALFKKGRLDESIQHTREAIRAQPNLAGAYLNLGAALGAKGRVDDAIVELRQAVRLAPDNAQAHYNLGFALASKGLLDDAIAQYQEALRLSPGNGPTQQSLREALAAKAARSPAKHP